MGLGAFRIDRNRCRARVDVIRMEQETRVPARLFEAMQPISLVEVDIAVPRTVGGCAASEKNVSLHQWKCSENETKTRAVGLIVVRIASVGARCFKKYLCKTADGDGCSAAPSGRLLGWQPAGLAPDMFHKLNRSTAVLT
jgi:hypothetical protein